MIPRAPVNLVSFTAPSAWGCGKKENITEVLESVTATKLIEPTVEIEKNGLTSLIRLIKQ